MTGANMATAGKTMGGNGIQEKTVAKVMKNVAIRHQGGDRRVAMLPAMAMLAAIAAMANPGDAMAAESFESCTGFITALPATISTPGVWCLNDSLSTGISTGQAIRVNTSHVTIDCNDFRIRGSAGGATDVSGIYATAKNNITIRNCAIRGFRRGVELSGLGHVIEGNRFDANTNVAITINADASVIRDNLITDTGGATSGATAYGINATGNIDISDNTIGGVAAVLGSGGAAYGIYSNYNYSGQVLRNRIRGVDPDGAGLGYGIYNSNSLRVVMRSNDVVDETGMGSIGLRCTNTNGRTIDNVVLGYVTPISGCADDGNVLSP